MKAIKILAVCLSLFYLSVHVAEAQNNSEYVKAKAYLLQKNEVYFTFHISSKNELITLTHVISIDDVKGFQVYAYANANEFEQFRQMGYYYTVLPHPGDVTEGIIMHDASKGIWQFDTYPTYTEYEGMMATFAADFPGLCKVVEIGTTPGGRKLFAAKISDNVGQSEAEPQFFYTSTMHGDEATGYILMLRLINHLLTNYGTNSEVTGLVDNMEIWINPLANPDGTYAGGNNTVSGATRENGNFIDLNRNFPGPLGQHPDGNAWQPENIAMMAFTDTMNFVLSANFHGGAEVMNYPFDTYTSSQKTHADDAWFQYISREFADTVHVYGPSVMTDLNNGITNGGDWYVIEGGRQDYMCFFEQGREITIELSATKLLPSNQLDPYWNYYYRSLINYMKQAGYGLRGIVTDACTGLPLTAGIFVETHDRDSSSIYSNSRFGDYYRPINAGNYSVTYSANGYLPQTFSFSISNEDTVIKNIELVPVVPVADFSANEATPCSGVVNFTCLTGGTTNWVWDFGDGSSSIEQNPVHVYQQSGTYSVSLTVGNCAGTNQVIKTDYLPVNIADDPVVTGAVRCGSGSVDLTATGNGTLNWYDAPSGGSLLGSGNIFSTPLISQTTTYYVESSGTQPSQYFGKPDSTGLGSYFNSTTVRSLYFDCYAPFTLVSVKVYAQTSGNRTIELRDNTGTVLQTATVNIPQWESRVTLNFTIQPGTGYELALNTTNANLFRSGSTSSPLLPYPYTLAGVASITGNNANNLRYYYFFYDWEVQQTGCTSARIPVVASVSQGPAGGVSSALVSSLCSGEGTVLSVSGNSGSAIQWQQSPDGINPWSDLAGGSSSSYTTQPLTNTVYFRAKISETGCSDAYSTISQVTVFTIPQIILTQTNETCYGLCNGKITSGVSSGTAPFTYLWSNFSTDSEAVSLCPGAYYLTVTDGNNCNSTASSTVAGYNILDIVLIQADTATCGQSNGTASVSVSGGTGNYTYSWPAPVTSTTNAASNLAAGTYTLTVTDNNSCSAMLDINIENAGGPVIDSIITQDPNCSGSCSGSLHVYYHGNTSGYTVSWNSSPQQTGDIATNLCEGIYSVMVTDANGCISWLQDSISDPQIISVSVNTTSTTCGLPNGSAVVSATGGTGVLSYYWSTGSFGQTISGLAPGQYSVTVIDENLCEGIQPVVINDVPGVSGYVTTADVSCFSGNDGSAFAMISSGTPPYTYLWSTGSTNATVSGLTQGTVTVTITDAISCTVEITDTIFQPDQVMINLVITPETSSGQSDGAATAEVSGGTPPYNYSWSNNTHNPSISGMQAGTYSLAIVDANGCFATTPVVIDLLNSVGIVNSKDYFSVFPNPAKDEVSISSGTEITSIEMLSATGMSLLFSSPFKGNFQLNFSEIAPGIYYLKATNYAGGVFVKKIVIVK